MAEKPDPYRCACGGATKDIANLAGYPARECVECGKQWWHTTCWRDHRHIIDSRRAHQCSVCTYYHCPTCQACSPDRHCACRGEALCA